MSVTAADILRDAAIPQTKTPIRIDADVGVIGAGFAGLTAGVELLAAGRTSLILFERAAEVGGVWRDNVYPGCACDVRSNFYSMASQPDPGWRSSYARQGDILRLPAASGGGHRPA